MFCGHDCCPGVIKTLQFESKLQVALTALSMYGFGAFGQRNNVMVGKHSGLVSQLPAGATQWLVACVTEVHHPWFLYTEKNMKCKGNEERKQNILENEEDETSFI